jgi:hypothetical protein
MRVEFRFYATLRDAVGEPLGVVSGDRGEPR